MKLIQPALLLLTLGALALYLRYFRSVLFDRMIALCFFALLALAIILPDITVAIANMLGVGRGTDLVFYLFAAGSLFVFVVLYSKHVATETKLTELVRAMAIEQAKKP